MSTNYNHFIPRDDASTLDWLNAFKEKVSKHADTLEVTATEASQLQDKAQAASAAFSLVTVKKQEQQSAVEKKNLTRKNEIKDIIDFSVRIKRHRNYTEDIGKDLGIVGISASTDRSVLQPVLKLTVYPRHVSVRFTKKGQKGVTIFTRIKGSFGWTKLIGGSTASPYIDDRPLALEGTPENREYMGMFWDNGTEIGQESLIASATFKGQ